VIAHALIISSYNRVVVSIVSLGTKLVTSQTNHHNITECHSGYITFLYDTVLLNLIFEYK